MDHTSVNCAIVTTVSSKSKVHTFGKFYYKIFVLLYNDKNIHKFKLSFIFRVCLINCLNIHFFLKYVKLHYKNSIKNIYKELHICYIKYDKNSYLIQIK